MEAAQQPHTVSDVIASYATMPANAAPEVRALADEVGRRNDEARTALHAISLRVKQVKNLHETREKTSPNSFSRMLLDAEIRHTADVITHDLNQHADEADQAQRTVTVKLERITRRASVLRRTARAHHVRRMMLIMPARRPGTRTRTARARRVTRTRASSRSSDSPAPPRRPRWTHSPALEAVVQLTTLFISVEIVVALVTGVVR